MLRLTLLVALAGAQFQLAPQCTCACCVASTAVMKPRRTICSPPSEATGMKCGDSCALSQLEEGAAGGGDSILRSPEVDEHGQKVVDFQRYCFYECMPQNGTLPDTLAMCVVKTPDKVLAAQTLDGNGRASLVQSRVKHILRKR
mmetsp:Transcript_14119/g.34315  ORF Transcript_14119/g.34315 Transcript_14119/m.34315 type:complete len:144 (-) Transcript_14119:35-466(-)